jgi:hypothetical protein
VFASIDAASRPPQTRTWLPVQTAVWNWRALGAPIVVIGRHPAAGSQRPPGSRIAPVVSTPPQTISSDPVHVAV